MAQQKTRDRVANRVSALWRARDSAVPHWSDINAVLMPRMNDFFASQTPNQSDRRNSNILDNTATADLITLQAGMHSGMTSPARPWLKIETSDTDLMESKAVSMWCDQVTQKLRNIFSRSNTYRSLHGMYGDMGAYGTATSILLPDYQDVIRFYPLAVGEYALGLDGRGEVNSVARKLQMTVGQIVERYIRKGYGNDEGNFDWSKASSALKNAWDRHDVDTYIPVTHLIQPRTYRDASRADARNMPFESVCIEDGADGDKVLNESGFRRFRGVCMRWFVDGPDIYGSRQPGMIALGDTQQLQVEQAKKSKAIDYMADPPIVVPSSMKNVESDFLPGGVSYADMTGPNAKVQNAFNVQLNLQHMVMDLEDVRKRIHAAYHADLFLFLSSLNGRGDRTAREVAEIHEEKLLMLGPVVENTEEALHHMVDTAFDAAAEAGILPPPPPEAQGAELKVEFIGLLSQAQRAVSMSSVDRIIAATASIATAMGSPEPWDNVDTDIAISKAGVYLGTDPEILRGRDQVAQIRQARQQAQQAAARQAQIAQAAETAKSLAGADMSGENALTNITRGFSPVQ